MLLHNRHTYLIRDGFTAHFDTVSNCTCVTEKLFSLLLVEVYTRCPTKEKEASFLRSLARHAGKTRKNERNFPNGPSWTGRIKT